MYLSVFIRGVTVHVFIPNRHGTGISVRCIRPYDECRQFTPNPEEGARSNATLFDNSQLKNSECQRMAWVAHLKTKPTRQWPCADSECVSHMDWQRLLHSTVCEMELCPTSLIQHKSKYSIILPYLRCNLSEYKTIIYCIMQMTGLYFSRFPTVIEVGADVWFTVFYFDKVPLVLSS